MKQTWVQKTAKIFILGCFPILVNTLFSNKATAQNYTKVAGVYQAYLDGDPVIMEGMKMYYAFNKNGLVFLAFGSSSGSAFTDISGGIKSGRIMTGNFSMNGNRLTMNMKKGTGETYWTFDPYEKTISGKSISLLYIQSL